MAQGENIKSTRPVAFASRTTKGHETRYPQLDLEAMGIDFALRRFRHYLVGSPKTIIVVTDHKPLCAIFNGSRNGSIRTERIKLLHQDIPFHVVYQPGKNNISDFISRRATPLSRLTTEEQDEPDSISKLLYMIHSTPIVDNIGLRVIAEETTTDKILNKLRSIIRKGQAWIPRNANPSLCKFLPILSSITVTDNGILLKDERIILPETLQQKAIEFAHRGSHPGESGLQRRLRYHFFFHDMNKLVHSYVQGCVDCQAFVNKKTQEPLVSHAVPDKNWSKVAVDLFGPMPSRNHIVVVQDLASRYPAGKIVSSTSAKKVIPALAEIYENFGNPERQLSDNGPPFNSVAMDSFCEKRNIEMEKTPPMHPSANPVETFMRGVGKTMKIAKQNHVNEKDALSQLLSNYRDTPHPATGVPPAAMLFRDNPQTSIFPRRLLLCLVMIMQMLKIEIGKSNLNVQTRLMLVNIFSPRHLMLAIEL